MMRPFLAWALVIRNRKGEWSSPSFVHRTRKEVKNDWSRGLEPIFADDVWRKRLKSGEFRIARVTITEASP